MVGIVGLYYFGQDERLIDEDAIRNGVDKAILLMLPRAVADPAGTLKRGSKKARKKGRKQGKQTKKSMESMKKSLDPVEKSGKRLRKKARSVVE